MTVGKILPPLDGIRILDLSVSCRGRTARRFWPTWAQT